MLQKAGLCMSRSKRHAVMLIFRTELSTDFNVALETGWYSGCHSNFLCPYVRVPVTLNFQDSCLQIYIILLMWHAIC